MPDKENPMQDTARPITTPEDNGISQFPSWPYHGAAEIEAVVQVLRGGQTNSRSANRGRAFEEAFAEYIHCRYGVAVANGTLALELALMALGIGCGDEVIVPCRTFIATASSVAQMGAKPVVADVDAMSQNITAASIEKKLTARTRAVIVVHLAGWPCDMDPILELAERRNLFVIEDCAQAHGAKYKGRPVGSMGSFGAFSFCHDKIMSLGGEGGMLTTNNKALGTRARSLKDHGKNHELLSSSTQAYPWPHEVFGSNYRMTEMQAALGCIQLEKLDEWLRIRKRNASILTRHLQDLPCTIPQPPEEFAHAWYRYYVFPELSAFRKSWDRDRVLATLNKAGIACNGGSCSEIQRERAFEIHRDIYETSTPVAHNLGQRSLAFLLHPTLQEHHMELMGREIRRVLELALK